MLLLLFISFINTAFGMCEYPHNPPAVCLQGTIVQSVGIKKDDLRCQYELKDAKLIRPSGTYRFDKNLARVDYKKTAAIPTKKIVTFYSKEKKCQKEGSIKTMAIYNCSDWYKDLPDFTLISFGKLKGQIRDPWTEKKVLIDCSKI